MSWDQYIQDDHSISSPQYPSMRFYKTSETYASSYSDIDYLHNITTSDTYYECSQLSVVNDNRYPIALVPFDANGLFQGGIPIVYSLYSSTFHYHSEYVPSSIITDETRTMDQYPVAQLDSSMGGFGVSIFDLAGAQISSNCYTNIPVIAYSGTDIDTEIIRSLLSNYLNNGDISIFDEYVEDGYMIFLTEAMEPEPQSSEFTIYNTGQRDKWTKSGRTFVDGPYYRWCRIKMISSDQVDGRFAFYRQGLSDGIIKLVPVYVADVVSCEYSTNGGSTWDESTTFPFEYIYGERDNELGTFISATRTGIGGDTGVPLFATRALAEGWVNHDPNVDISDALNYEDIANRYPIVNPTGAEEIATTMGDGSYLRNYFSQEFVCSRQAIYEISNDFFDTGSQGLWDAIEEGLPMMGSNPIDVICGLKWFPFDLSTVLSGLESPQNYIYFGGYQYTLPSATVRKVINHGGYLDMGSFTIKDAFSNPSDFRNFEPYCRLKIYIPTVGIQDLSYNKYRGKTVSVRLYVDIKSGSTLIALMADGVLYDFFNGSCGVDIPITLTDKAQLAQAQLRNISNLAGVGINMGTAAATKNLGAAVAATANFESTMLDINNTSADQFNVTKGGSSPMGNGCFLPNYIYLIFEYIKTDETSNLNQLEGRATNKSGNLNSFSGYLQIDSINLRTTADMSESEKNEFVNLLQSGIFI